MAKLFDVVVIGAGPGGYVTAIRASQLGYKVAIIERENLGGICLNWGCIPTKALLRSAEMFSMTKHLKDYGLKADNLGYDFEAIVKRSRGAAKQLNGGVAYLMKKNKIEVIEGAAKLEKGTDAPKVVVDLKSGGSETLTAKHVILATGARARTIPAIGLEPDGEHIWTYREALTPKACPKSLVVIGSGAIGMEFACFYRSLGADVTVVEAVDRILPAEDAEISKAAQSSFGKQGIKFKTGAKVEKLQAVKSGVVAKVNVNGKTETITADKAIVAVGITGNIENLGLEGLGVKTDRGHVVNDDHGKTNVKGLYAIGDVAGPPWLAHKASHEGVHCIEHIKGLKPSNLTTPIPGCTYTHPQVASVGLTEAQAKDQGYKKLKVGRFPFSANGKAIAAGETEGFIKTIFDEKTGALLGAHMFGHEVTEMIQGFALAITLEATEAEIMATVFPHPTMSEGMHESVLDAYDQVLHT